tara:strand:+ start:1867 stop:2439 length:573 start_codon:yes stop_codon:yes gene_type:complete
MQQSVPLFPLSAHLLPGGRLALRIFEVRYVKMVKEACATNSGFGICMLNAKGDTISNQHILPIGTYAKVVDFDLLSDGMLGVTVEGLNCFTINSIETQKDGLRIGQCDAMPPWQLGENPLVMGSLNTGLQEIFDKYPELQNIYPNPLFTDPLWVIYRWLELMPIEAQQKQLLLGYKDHVKAFQFLTQLIK